MAGFNWSAFGKWALKAAEAAPAAIQMVEAIHGAAKSGADKTTLAAQALTGASSIAEFIDPNDQAAIAGVNQLAQSIVTALKTPPPA